MSLFSNRLQLIPLNSQQLQLLINDKTALSANLQINPVSVQIDKDFQHELDEALGSFVLDKLNEFPQHIEWYTHWLVVLADERRCIGGIGASGFPNEKGETMIGYYIDERFEGKGYATETVQLLCTLFMKEVSLKGIIATIPEAHIASEKVLTKNGFVSYQGEEQGLKYFRLERN